MTAIAIVGCIAKDSTVILFPKSQSQSKTQTQEKVTVDVESGGDVVAGKMIPPGNTEPVQAAPPKGSRK